jgi:exodeoxyribonuclease-3
MKVTTLNANGLRSAERRGFSSWLQKSAPDVLCLQEIRCDEDSLGPELWSPAGWKAGWNPAAQKGYAGTAVWGKAEIAQSSSFSKGIGLERADAEGRATGLHLPDLDIWSLYLPSGSSGPDRQEWKFAFLDYVFPWFEQLARSGRPTLVCGDLNIAHQPIDLKNWKGNQKNSGFLPEEREWFTRLLASGWRDSFRHLNPDAPQYSWWSNRGRARENDVGWRIDYVLATPNVPITAAWIEREAGLSDHAPVSVEIDLGALR